jgi:hypothetical protein
LKTELPPARETIAAGSVDAPGRDAVPQARHAAGRFASRPWARHLLVLLGFALLTFILTLPIGLRLSTEVPGGGDAWQHVWNLWWVKEALLTYHTNPYHTDLLFYPEGANLYFHTLVLTAGLMGIPLQLAGLNLITTYNLILLLSFVIGGYGAYLLCRYLTRNDWASFVGGAVFAFAPYHMAHMFGHMNLSSLQWMPFYLLLLLKAADAPGGGKRNIRRGALYAAGAGALLALNAYTEWLYAIFLVMLTGVMVAWRVLLPSERRAARESHLGWAESALRLTLLVGTFVVLTAPVLFPMLDEARKGYAQQPPQEVLFYSADLVSALLPSELHPVWGKAVERVVQGIPPYLPLKNPSERVLTVGFVALALALFALWRLLRERHVRFWAFTGALMWLLSLGPVLQVLGRTEFTAFGVTVPLPYLLVYKLPLLSIMRTPARLTVLVMLALAVLAAYALAALMSWAANRDATARSGVPALAGVVAVVVPLLILFEYLAVPFPTVPPGWNVPIYQRIAQEHGRFAVLELPLRPFSDYMAYQTIHGKPLVGGYLSRQPPYRLPEENSAVHYLLDTTSLDDPVAAQITEVRGVEMLRAANIKYVIIRWWAFTPEQRAAMQSKLDRLFARPPDLSYPEHQVDAWQLFP